jgi:hypothetical protein
MASYPKNYLIAFSVGDIASSNNGLLNSLSAYFKIEEL